MDRILSFAPDLAEANDGFSPSDFAKLANLEAGHFWFRSRNRLIIWALKRYFPEAENFLELGCGTGFVLMGLERAFPHLQLSGGDAYSVGLKYASDRLSRTALYQLDAKSVPFEGEFDVVGAFDVLEHVEDDVAMLFSMRNAIKLGGGALITVPQHPFLWSALDECSCHKRRYSRQDLLKKVKSAGFEIVRVTSFVTSLFPFMMLSRFIQKKKPKENFDAFMEFKINPVLNRFLEGFLKIEGQLLKTGLSFPVGGSLLMVAKRV